jgi:hypothetical protein
VRSIWIGRSPSNPKRTPPHWQYDVQSSTDTMVRITPGFPRALPIKISCPTAEGPNFLSVKFREGFGSCISENTRSHVHRTIQGI